MKFSSFFFKILNIVIILAIIAQYFHGQIYAFYWHSLHDNPIVWEGLIVQVPNSFIAEENKNEKTPINALNLRSYAEEEQPHIYIQKIPREFSFEEDFVNGLIPENYKLVEKNDCFLLEKKCIWIKMENKKNAAEGDNFYMEQILFDSLKFWFVYQGRKKNSKYFIEVINHLKLEKIQN